MYPLDKSIYSFLWVFIFLSMINQAQDDQHDVNINIHNDPNDSLMQDIPPILHHQHDSTDTPHTPPSEDSDAFESGDLDDNEQQDAAL